MALITLLAGKGATGVTTTALACTLSWSSRTVLAECDPAGGSVQAGYLRCELPPGRGLLPLAVAELRSDSLVMRLSGNAQGCLSKVPTWLVVRYGVSRGLSRVVTAC